MAKQLVVDTEDHTLGTVVAERGASVIVESGLVFKTRHAIPREFLHEHDGELRATVGRSIVNSSPKVDLDAWDERPVLEHYGIEEAA